MPRSVAAILASIVALWLLLITTQSAAQDYQIETIADGLDHPWSIAWLPDDRALVTERVGRLRLLANNRLQDAPIEGVPELFAASQGGLFEALPDPEYVNNGWIYLSFAHGTADANALRVIRARLDGVQLADHQLLFTATPLKDTPVHYSGRMTFLADGTLVFGVGDGFNYREQAQQLDSHLGTLIRIHRDGSIPDDNPFVDTPDARPEIFTIGHRNVQGLVFDVRTGRLWSHEHGPRGGDEVNRIEAGGNYGWPVATHGIDYSGARISPFTSRPDMIDPAHVWTPSIAPAGMTLYHGEQFPEWDGKLLVAALAARHARVLALEGDRIVDDSIILDELDARLRDIRTGPDGAVWVLTDANPGKVLRITRRAAAY
ncbi:MAG: PQQ-dependent sugar dehydrogenase [Wenzhouxiangellaceae bacterium]|nr:PQQ-dependent sugar dehydrogenase [Wenzhouxiangellaceae bacterium]